MENDIQNILRLAISFTIFITIVFINTSIRNKRRRKLEQKIDIQNGLQTRIKRFLADSEKLDYPFALYFESYNVMQRYDECENGWIKHQLALWDINFSNKSGHILRIIDYIKGNQKSLNEYHIESFFYHFNSLIKKKRELDQIEHQILLLEAAFQIIDDSTINQYVNKHLEIEGLLTNILGCLHSMQINLKTEILNEKQVLLSLKE